MLRKNASPAPSPKHTYLLSRDPTASDLAGDMELYSLGEQSPSRPIRSPDGSYVSRSILGDSSSYISVDSQHQKQNAAAWRTESTKPQLRSGMAIEQRARMQLNEFNPELSEASDLDTPLGDPTRSRSAYLFLLRSHQARAAQAYKEESEASARMAETLPLLERFDRKRDGKIISSWNSQQRTWAGIEQRLSTRLGTDAQTLLMSSIDEYRAKTEEYDALQLARPIADRFGQSTWQMDLRGGGSRMILASNTFSGLESNIKFALRDNPVVRKPLKYRMNKTDDLSSNPSVAIAEKRMRLRESLRAVRPHIVSLSDADELVVHSKDLFRWAIASSDAYYDEQEAPLQALSLESETSASLSEASEVGERLLVLYHTQCDVALFCERGHSASHVAAFTNAGSIAVSYSWKLVSGGAGAVTAGDSADDLIRESIFDRETEDFPRTHLISRQRASVFCRNYKGFALPGETVRTEFKFFARDHVGAIAQTWVLETFPAAKVLIEELAAHRPAFAHIQVTLRGLSGSVDETAYLRSAAQEVLGKRALQSFIELEIYKVIRRVRSPVRLTDLTRRKLALFESINAELLKPLRPLFLSEQRLEDFFQLHDTIQAFTIEVNATWKAVKATFDRRDDDEEEEEVDDVDEVSLIDEGSLARIAANRCVLFPEEMVEVFDEVDEAALDLRWDMHLQLELDRLEQLRSVVADVSDMQNVLETMRVNKIEEAYRMEKEEMRLNAQMERRQQRKTEDGSDYEDSEEEEGDEEPEGARGAEDDDESPGEARVEPKHPLEMRLDGLLFDARNRLHMLFLRDFTVDADLFVNDLVGAFDKMADLQTDAVTAAKLSEDYALTVSTAEKGLDFWSTLPTLEELDASSKTKKKGGAAAVPSGKKKGVEVATQEQLDAAMNHMKTRVYGALLDAAVASMCRQDSIMQAASEVERMASSCRELTLCSVLREDDFNDSGNGSGYQGRVAFVSIDCSVFSSSTPRCAFESIATARLKMLSSVRLVVQHGIRAVVLLYEDQGTSHTDDLDVLGKTISACLGEYLNMEFVSVPCFPQLTLALGDLADIADFNVSPCPIFFMRNVCHPEAVPAVRSLRATESAEAEIVPIGLEEYTEEMRLAHCRKKVLTRSAGREVLCSPIASEALREVVGFCRDKYGAIWVDACMSSLFDQHGVLSTCAVKDGRFISTEIRDTVVWGAVLLTLSCLPDYLAYSPDTIQDEEQLNFAAYLRSLFPTVEGVPAFTAVIGGALRPDKLKLLDRLIDIVSTYFLVLFLCSI